MNIMGNASARSAGLAGIVCWRLPPATCCPAPARTRPRSSPDRSREEGDAFVVAVNDRVTRATAVLPALGFSGRFHQRRRRRIRHDPPRRRARLSIWENVEDGLLAGQGADATVLNEVQVDGAGLHLRALCRPHQGRGQHARGDAPDHHRQARRHRRPTRRSWCAALAGDGAHRVGDRRGRRPGRLSDRTPDPHAVVDARAGRRRVDRARDRRRSP